MTSRMAATQELCNSQLKIAQIFSCINKNYPHIEKMITNILEKEGDINEVFPASYFLQSSQPNLTECTILHIAAYERDAEIFKILLDNKADFTLQSLNGYTVLHYLFDSESSDVKNELINCVLSAHVRFENSSNPCNNSGISHFHIACMANNIQAVQFYLKHAVSVQQVVNMDSLKFAGYSPLHFAIENCSIETIKILLNSNANISLKDARGKTALHCLLLQKVKLFETLNKNKEDVTNAILEKIDSMDYITTLLLPNDDADDVGLSRVHVACTMQDVFPAEELIMQAIDINHSVKFDSPVWPGYTALHFAAHFNMKIFKILLKKGALIDAKSAEGLTPLDICFKKGNSDDPLTVLTSKTEWTTAKFLNGEKLIEILECMRELRQFQFYLERSPENINTQIIKCPPFWIGFTPTHFAVLVSKDTDTKLIELCLKHQADITIQDINGWTPIHLAFRLNKIEITVLLLEHFHSTEDFLDNEGLSVHDIIQLLRRHESAFKLRFNANDIFEDVGSSWLHAACFSGDCDGLKSRLNYSFPKPDMEVVISCTDSTIFWSRFYGYTALHVAIEQPSNEGVVDILLRHGADVFTKRPDGITPIYAVLSDISKEYLTKLFVWHLETCEDFRKRQRNLKLHLEQLSGITMLHVACRTYNVNAVRILLTEEKMNVNVKVHRDCPIWAGYTPLHVLLRYSIDIQDQYSFSDFQEILIMLLTHEADVTAVNAEGDTPVHFSFDHCFNDVNDFNFGCASFLMDYHKDFSVNPVNAKKISHFHIACMINDVEAVREFLAHGVDANQPIDFFARTCVGQSPLHLTLKRNLSTDNQLKTIDLLLLHGANVLAEDSYGFTVLHKAASDFSQNTKLLEKLVSCGADVNAKNIFGASPMELLLKVDKISLTAVELMLNAGCQTNNCNYINEEGYIAMIIDYKYHKSPQTKIFERIMTAEDIINVDGKKRTVLHNIVTTCKPNVDISYSEIIDQFEKLGIDVDIQDASGKTALHLAAQFGNITAVDALINAGADVNILDYRDKTALSYALKCGGSNEHQYVNLVKIIVVHIRKLQLMGLHVEELNTHLLEWNSLNMSFDIEGLFSERNYVRKIVVDTQPLLILDDFLLETEALVSYPFTVDLKRKKVYDLLKSITGKLTGLKSVLMFQYRKTLKGVAI